MEKNGKIKAVKFISEWAGPNGTVYYHEVEFDNGDKGQIGTKEKLPPKIAVGAELTYTIENTGKGNKIKPVQPSGGFQGGGKKAVIDPKVQMISFAMAYTKDLVVAGKVELSNMSKYFEIIYDAMVKKI